MTCQKEDIELSVDVFGQIEFYQRWQQYEVFSLVDTYFLAAKQSLGVPN